jgi:simple sugar transport system permease protein
MTTGTTSLSTQGDERLAQTGFVRGIFRRVEIGALIGAIVVWLFFAIIAVISPPNPWISTVGVSRILDQASTIGIMAIAVALLMIGGEFDLSTGVMVGTTGLVAGLLSTRAGWNLWPAMLAALVFALIVGYLNGLMVIKTGLPSFIVTLATFFILRGANVGVTRIVTKQVTVSGIDQAAGFDAARAFFNWPIDFIGVEWRSTIIWWILITILASWVLLRTKQGSWIFAVGGDAEAARKVGVPSNRVKIALFMTTALAAWLVGMMTIARARSAQVCLYHRRDHRRHAAHRRLWLGGGCRHRRDDLWHGTGRYRVRRLGHRLVLQLSGSDAPGGGAGEQLYTAAGDRNERRLGQSADRRGLTDDRHNTRNRREGADPRGSKRVQDVWQRDRPE